MLAYFVYFAMEWLLNFLVTLKMYILTMDLLFLLVVRPNNLSNLKRNLMQIKILVHIKSDMIL